MVGKEQAIREVVQDFVTSEKLFTSVDVGNSIKMTIRTMDIRNRDVRDWLRANIGKDPMLSSYVSEPIDVNNGARVAMLYRPHDKDASEYADRNQRALSPSDISALSSAGPAVAVADDDASGTSLAPSPSVCGTGSSATIIRKCKYTRRIQIPGDITGALGWIPGQSVDTSKIKIHTGTLSSKLKVWYDGRVSIPRKVVGFGQDPVNIILKDGEITFEKA